MALVQVAKPRQKTTIEGAHDSGGRTGTAVGAVAGGIIGGIAAGVGSGGSATALGAMQGAAGGAALGNTVGNFVAPGSSGHEAIDRRAAAAAQGPEMYHSERSDALRQSLTALNSQPPALQQQYGAPLVTAYLSSLANDHTGMALPGQQPQPGVA